MPDSNDLLAKSPAKPAAREEDKTISPSFDLYTFLENHFAVADKPTDLKHSSPKVWKR